MAAVRPQKTSPNAFEPSFVCGASKDLEKPHEADKSMRPTSLDFLQRQTESFSHLFDGLFKSDPALNETTPQQSGALGIKNDEYFRTLLSAEDVNDKLSESLSSHRDLPRSQDSRRGMASVEETKHAKSKSNTIVPKPLPASSQSESTGASGRRSSQPEAQVKRGGSEPQLVPRRSSGPLLALPRVSSNPAERRGSAALAISLDHKDHEALAKQLRQAEERVKLRNERFQRISAHFQKHLTLMRKVSSVHQERDAVFLRAQAQQAQDELDQATFERNRKEKQLMHAMSLLPDAPSRSTHDLQAVDVLRKYWFAQREDQHKFKPT